MHFYSYSSTGYLAQVLLDGRWYNFLYGSGVNVFNLLVCLIGATMFAKLTVGIFAIVLICTGSVILSFFVKKNEILVSMSSLNSLLIIIVQMLLFVQVLASFYILEFLSIF